MVFGSLIGTAFSGFIVIGSIIYPLPPTDLLPTNFTEGCDPFNSSSHVYQLIDFNQGDATLLRSSLVAMATLPPTPSLTTAAGRNETVEEEEVDWDAFPYVIYRTSYLWIAPFNFTFTFLITCLISVATGG